MKTILLGGAGFIGTALANYLKKNNVTVVVIDSKSRIERNKISLDGIQTYEMEYPEIDAVLLNFLFCKDDALIHLACTTNPHKSMLNINYDASSNILPSIDLFSIAIKNKLSKIIFSSSGGTVYGSTNNKIIKENDEKSPICAYGASKLAIENYLSIMTMDSNTHGISLRIGNPFGLYQLNGTTIGAIAAFLKATINTETINIYGDGSVVRDYIYIDDLSEAFYSALKTENLNGSYNVGSGAGNSINQILDTIQSILKIKHKIKYHNKRGFDVPHIVLDTSKFNSKTGWHCQHTVETGIQKLWSALK